MEVNFINSCFKNDMRAVDIIYCQLLDSLPVQYLSFTPSEEASTQEFPGPSKLPKGKTMVIARTKNNEKKTYNIII